jgi:hypothetical protein
MTFISSSEELATHTIKPGDPDFLIQGKFTISRRASIEISPNCPQNLLNTIAHAVEKGWIIPVATITEREKMFIGLTGA